MIESGQLRLRSWWSPLVAIVALISPDLPEAALESGLPAHFVHHSWRNVLDIVFVTFVFVFVFVGDVATAA